MTARLIVVPVLAFVAGVAVGATRTPQLDAWSQSAQEPRFQVERQGRVVFIRDLVTSRCFIALHEGGITEAACGLGAK